MHSAKPIGILTVAQKVEGQTFSSSYDSTSPPPPSPLYRQLAGGKGGGEVGGRGARSSMNHSTLSAIKSRLDRNIITKPRHLVRKLEPHNMDISRSWKPLHIYEAEY